MFDVPNRHVFGEKKCSCKVWERQLVSTHVIRHFCDPSFLGLFRFQYVNTLLAYFRRFAFFLHYFLNFIRSWSWISSPALGCIYYAICKSWNKVKINGKGAIFETNDSQNLTNRDQLSSLDYNHKNGFGINWNVFQVQAFYSNLDRFLFMSLTLR